MIDAISITNFKSIREAEDVPLKPLTLFTGANSSGKSSIMETISSFGQASRWIDANPGASLSPQIVFMRGDVKNYPRELGDFVAYKKNPRALISLEIDFRPDGQLIENITELVGKRRPKTPELRKTIPWIFHGKHIQINSVGYGFAFRVSNPIYVQNILVNGRALMSVRKFPRDPAGVIMFPDEYDGKQTQNTSESLFDERVFASTSDDYSLGIISRAAVRILKYIQSSAKAICLISGERGKIEPELRPTEYRGGPPDVYPTWIGPNGQYLIEILSRCMTLAPEKAKKIQKWAERFQLPAIRAGYIGKGLLESHFTDKTMRVNLNTTLAGLGSRQILSIITQIFWSEPGSVIMIEEPEISLHPENQVLLHELFSEAIAEGRQIICSTHSPFFVLALSKIVRKGLLPLKDIAVYHVEKSKDGTHIKPLKLNKHGFIVSGVPSFMKVEEELFHDWSMSLEEE
jgi:hypothetical protein